VFNPGAYTHYSYALRDAVAAISKPNRRGSSQRFKKREKWRRISVIEPVCAAQISGKGNCGYLIALGLLKTGSRRVRSLRKG